MSFSGEFNEALLERFIQLIATHTGLHIRPEEREALTQKIRLRMKIFHISVPEIYYLLLKDSSPQSNNEWQELAISLTVCESYFFRDKGQFSLLRHKILPELIAAQKYTKTLRIWSAGCSTGEEPYSLAILLNELIPDWERWNIFILGTDINQNAIEQAQKGVYSSWSFRLLEAQLKERYFFLKGDKWHLNKDIRERVIFKNINLVKEEFDNSAYGIKTIDLIICRNVFVYFEKPAISLVLNKFNNTLKLGGYLLTAHSELQGQDIGLLEAKLFPESVIYQRRENLELGAGLWESKPSIYPDGEQILCFSAPANNLGMNFEQSIGNTSQLMKPAILLQEAGEKINNTAKDLTSLSVAQLNEKRTKDADITTLLLEAEALFKNKFYALAIEKAEQAITLESKQFYPYYLQAEIYANLGKYDKAIHYCQMALKVNPLAEEPLYLLAHIADEKGDINGAKSFLKKIIYLVPYCIYAYLELGYLYDKEGEGIKATKMRTVALEILEKLPFKATLEKLDNLTVEELIVKINKMLPRQL
ncbi:tetratricopeptide repeat protein [Cyanobacteria bacterium FACHB-472]|nr:tetratricopeptide repeat protein [Cyanobacteria bacterium FACHB-472]